MNGDALPGLVDAIMPVLVAAALAGARPLGFMIVFPVFGWIGVKGMTRNVLALAMAAPALPVVYAATGAAGGLPPEALALLIGKEVLVGAALGGALGIPFWGADLAGAYLDFYRGASVSTVMNPAQDSESLVSGVIFLLALIGVFLVTGGFRVMLDALYRSWVIWPILEPLPELATPLFPFFKHLLTRMASVALALAGPILIAMFLAELVLALISRFAQQINVFDATLGVKNLVYLLLLPPWLVFLMRVYGPGVIDIPGTMGVIETMVQGGAR